MWTPRPLKVARRFLAAVDAHDLAACAALLREDFRYIDSHGNVLEGKAAGLHMFELLMGSHRDSRIVVASMSAFNDTVLIRARVDSPDPRLAGEALYKLKVERGLLTQIESNRFDTRPTARLLLPEILERKSDPES